MVRRHWAWLMRPFAAVRELSERVSFLGWDGSVSSGGCAEGRAFAAGVECACAGGASQSPRVALDGLCRLFHYHFIYWLEFPLVLVAAWAPVLAA